jgi:hypothetical protein
MRINRLYFLVLTCCCFAVQNTTKAQSYSIETFEGTKAEIKLAALPSGRGLGIRLLTDSMFLTNYMGTEQVHILNNKFLEIVYDVMGGPGLEVEDMILLSVINKKLVVSLAATYYTKSITPLKDHLDKVDDIAIHKLNVTIIGQHKGNFKLVARKEDQNNSGSQPSNNYKRNSIDTLSFDLTKFGFYNGHQDISKSFSVFDPATENYHQRLVKGRILTNNLGKAGFFLIDGDWFKEGLHDTLYRVYYK